MKNLMKELRTVTVNSYIDFHYIFNPWDHLIIMLFEKVTRNSTLDPNERNRFIILSFTTKIQME